MSLLSLRNIRFAHGQKNILDGVDLDLAPGEVLVVVGPSGCGKTWAWSTAAGGGGSCRSPVPCAWRSGR